MAQELVKKWPFLDDGKGIVSPIYTITPTPSMYFDAELSDSWYEDENVLPEEAR